MQAIGIFSHQHVGADGDRLLMLGIVVERDAGDTVESSLLSHIARVGNNPLGMGRQPAELKVVKRGEK